MADLTAIRMPALALLWLSSCVASGPRLSSPWMSVEVPPAPAKPDLALGEKLYGWNCLPCHGPEGRGDGPMADRIGLRPRDFTRGLFQLKTSGPDDAPFDDDLYRTIAAGIPVAGMPAVHNLDPDDRWALVAWVKRLAPPRAPPAGRIAAPDFGRADPDRGRALFASCAPCHGPGGRGDGPAAPALADSKGRPNPPPDLTRGEVAFKAGSRAEDVFRVLATGMPGTAMPSFATIPERDRRDLAAHVVSLYVPVPEGERIYLSAGCVACHTIGRGKLIGPDLAGVSARRTRDWLRAWMRDPALLIATDAEALRLYRDYGSAMPAPGLSEAGIEAVLDFLQGR